MGSAISGVMGGGGGGGLLGSIGGGGGGGLLGSIGGIVGGIFGGPIGAMIGQAVGNLLQEAVGKAAKETVDHMQKNHGMPKFLADQAKSRIDECIASQRKDVPQEATDCARERFGGPIRDFGNDLSSSMCRHASRGFEEEGGGGGGWLQAIAKAMGKTLGEKAAKMVELSEEMSAKSAEGANLEGDKAKQNANEFNQLMTKFQATGQEYSMLNNVFSTAIKALGESLSSMARKQ
jgi:hypothetical protein